MSDASGDAIDRVMVDIETLGTDPGCSILSVGAVRFDLEGPMENQEFYRNVSLKSCEDAGLEIDVGTLEWWMEQDNDVQDVLTGGDDLGEVLELFARFYADATEIWAYSPSFDCDILAAAYDAVGIVPPWKYYEERCCRTLDNLPIAPELEREGDKHDALDDAKHQARVAAATLRKMED